MAKARGAFTFERWQLTAAEREVGLLLLKCFSHREVAEIRQTRELE